MQKLFFLSLFIASINTQCSLLHKTASNAEVPYSYQYGLVIASKRADCQGLAKQKCFLAKSLGATKWEFFYSPIEGFDYEEGYEYHLEIKKTEIKNPPADTSTAKYTLVNIISKEKKNSDIRNETEKPIFESTWDVVTLNGKELKGFISFKNGEFAVTNIGCNTLTGIEFETDTVKKTVRFDIEKVYSTLMACPEDHDSELLKTLLKVTHFKEVSKNKLLLKEDAKILLKLRR